MEDIRNLAIDYFKHKDAYINDRTCDLDDKLSLQRAFHVAEKALRDAIASQPGVEVGRAKVCAVCGKPVENPKNFDVCNMCGGWSPAP